MSWKFVSEKGYEPCNSNNNNNNNNNNKQASQIPLLITLPMFCGFVQNFWMILGRCSEFFSKVKLN